MQTKENVLKTVFGYDSFRPKQGEIIDSIFQQADKGVLAIMPTGGGKSILFQVPALMQEGLSIVVSPLISLMKDQIDALEKKGVHAKTYNSSMTESEKKDVIGALQIGYVQLLYVAPERFDDEDFMFLLKQQEINVFAVDESHGISQHGHDFRPSYRRLKWVISELHPKQTVAVTATATPEVQNDICIQLGIPLAKRFITGFNRDNLVFKVKACSDSERVLEIAAQIADYKRQGHGTGIIYSGTRTNAEGIANLLSEEYNTPATFYHAGMDKDERTIIQDNWFKNGGIIVATNAFGMGIDKADVRFVIHANMPGNIENYYQEAGRAGRDGKISVCKIYVDIIKDIQLQNFFINMSCPPVETVKKFWEWVCWETRSLSVLNMTQKQMAAKADIDEAFVGGCMSVLRQSKLFVNEKRGSYEIKKFEGDAENQIDFTSLRNRRIQKTNRLADMKLFISQKDQCRMQYIVNYFGEKTDKVCGKCDICQKKAKKGINR